MTTTKIFFFAPGTEKRRNRVRVGLTERGPHSRPPNHPSPAPTGRAQPKELGLWLGACCHTIFLIRSRRRAFQFRTASSAEREQRDVAVLRRLEGDSATTVARLPGAR